MATHPREDLDRDADRTNRTCDPGKTSAARWCAGRQCARSRGAEEQRAQQVRSAAVVLLRRDLTVQLVGPDRDVLGSVVAGELTATEGDRGRNERCDRRDRLTRDGGQRRPSGRGSDRRATHNRHRHTGALEREAHLRQRSLHVGEERERLGEPQRATKDGGLHARSEATLATCGRQDPAAIVTNGSAPRGRAVHEHAVLEGHAAEAQLLHDAEGTVRPVDAGPVVELVSTAARGQRLTLVGIGGHGGAGKTTLAWAIPGAQIVSTDEFWMDDGFDLVRLRAEVIEPLTRGETARFSSYDWAAKTQRGERVVEPTGVVVVEGVCALHRDVRDAYAVRVWVEAPYDLRVVRGVSRDGEEARSTWVERWIPAEERYVERDDPIACADLVVDGTGPPPAPADDGSG